MLAPVYELLFRNNNSSLCLIEDQVVISYKKYKADNQSDMEEIVKKQLAPGKKNLSFTWRLSTGSTSQIDFCNQKF